MPATNADESRVWLDRARIQAHLAEFATGKHYWHEACHHLVRAAEMAIKAAYIACDTPVPRKHDIGELLADCPAPAVRERISASFDWTNLDEFSRYYLSVYPDGETADQASFLWCSQVLGVVMQSVEESLA